MLYGLRIFPNDTKIPFMSTRLVGFALSTGLILASLFLLFSKGLNFGIDFTGGVVMELRFEKPIDLPELRRKLNSDALGIESEISLQTLGSQQDILLRLGRPKEDSALQPMIAHLKTAISTDYPSVSFRKIDALGGQVSGELLRSGAISLGAAVLAILAYIWLRFEWQFGLGAVIALVHDVILTLGLYALLQLEFNLTSVAAILTIIGYSINDSVVIYDRVREFLRKFKKRPLNDVLNQSINSTLSRTILTAGTTIAALLALVLLGGHVLYGFSLAVLFGVIVGTYSSICIAAPLLTFFPMNRKEI